MAYADPWDPTTPAGTEERRQGDDRMREKSRAIEQRLNTLMNFSTSTDPATDPVRLLADTVGAGVLKAGAVALTNLAAALVAKLRTTLTASFTPAPGTVAAGGETTQAVTLTGAAVGDVVWIVPDPGDIGTRLLIIRAIVTAADTITVYYTNPSSTARTPVIGATPWVLHCLKVLS